MKRKKAASMSLKELASYIDHSVLKPEFSQQEIRQHIKSGIEFGCRTVCINPSAVPIARELSSTTGTGICVVCDFPFGLSSTESKVIQAEQICTAGDIFELDVVANYGWIRSGLWDLVTEDIRTVVELCHSFQTQVKTIFETDALTLEEVRKATECAAAAGSDFVKTSTGFYTGSRKEGATDEVLSVMLETAAGRCKVKASGAIRTREKFLHFIDLGVDRMGIGYASTPVVLGLEA